MGEPKDNIAIAAAFLSGFYTLQTLNFCWTASFPTLLKFGITPSKIGCFMGETGSSMNFWVSWGILLAYGLSFCGWTGVLAFIAPVICTIIYCIAFAYTCYVKRFSREKAFLLFIFVLVPIVGLFVLAATGEPRGENCKFVCPVVSCFTTVCTFITHCIIFYFVVFGHGYEGVRKLYFWLSASALAYQFDSSITVKVAGAQVAWLFLAMEVSYFIIPFIHLCCERFHRALGVRDLNFFTVFWHLFSICITTGMAVELWIVNIYLNWDNPMFISSTSLDEKKTAHASFKRGASPFFMGIIGMGSIFWLFPAVWPFMVCHYAHFRFVMLFSAVLSSPATLIPWALNDGHIIVGAVDVKLKTKFDVWNYIGSNYHFLWFILVSIFLLFWIHMCCIHFPRCFVARSVLHSGWAVVCGSLFFFFTSLFKAVGLTACFANAIGPSFSSTGGLSIGSSVTFGGSPAVKIEGGTDASIKSVKIQSFQIGLDTGATNKITGTFADRTIGGTVTLSSSTSNKPTIILHGLVTTVSTSALSNPSGPSGTFEGDTTAGTIKLQNQTLNLGLTTGYHPGGENAAKIISLTMIKITNLSITPTSGSELQIGNPGSEQTVASMDIILVFQTAISGTLVNGNRTFTFNGSTLNTGAGKSSVKFYNSGSAITGVTPSIASGAQFAASSGGTVTISPDGNVTISALRFSSTSGQEFKINNATGAAQGKSGNITASTTHRVTLYGYTASTKEVQSESVTVTDNANSAISLGKDTSDVNGNTLKLDASQTQNLDLNVSESQPDEGQDKAGSFLSSDAGNYLTKMEITLPLASSFYIDDVSVGNSVTLTLDFRPGIQGNSSGSGFSVSNSNVNQAKSCLTFPGGPQGDFVHGPTFGTVGFNFSLFHLTASIFTSQAYSVGIGSFKCAVESGCPWPTQGLGGFRSYWWWSHYALKSGNRRFWSLADVDIISVIS